MKAGLHSLALVLMLLIGGRAGGKALALETAPIAGVPGFIEPNWGDARSNFDGRFGAVAGATDALGEQAAGPRFPFSLPGAWSVLAPRLQFGGLNNPATRGNETFAGFLWTVPVLDGLVIEAFVGSALRSSSDPYAASLGCNPSLNSGGSIGYRFSDRWSVMLMFDRLANGRTSSGAACNRSQSLNNYGARLGFSF